MFCRLNKRQDLLKICEHNTDSFKRLIQVNTNRLDNRIISSPLLQLSILISYIYYVILNIYNDHDEENLSYISLDVCMSIIMVRWSIYDHLEAYISASEYEFKCANYLSGELESGNFNVMGLGCE